MPTQYICVWEPNAIHGNYTEHKLCSRKKDLLLKPKPIIIYQKNRFFRQNLKGLYKNTLLNEKVFLFYNFWK